MWSRVQVLLYTNVQDFLRKYCSKLFCAISWPVVGWDRSAHARSPVLHGSLYFDYLGWLQYLYKHIKYQYQISNIKYRILIWNINTISQICCGSGSLPYPVLPCSPYQAGQPGAGGGNFRANNRIIYEYLGPTRVSRLEYCCSMQYSKAVFDI